MGVRIVNTDPTGSDRYFEDGTEWKFGAEIEVEAEVADSLVEQGVGARVTSNAAKQAKKESDA